MLNTIEKRMAFYAKLLNGNRLKLSPEDEREWRRDFPEAIEAQYAELDRGELPVPMTLENVRRLKTLHVKNAHLGVIFRQWERGQNSEGDGLGSS